jgi:hypothetical protein
MFIRQLDEVTLSAAAIVDHLFRVATQECCNGQITVALGDQTSHNVNLMCNALGHFELFKKLRNRSRDGGFLIGSPVFVKCVAELSRLSVVLRKHLDSGCDMPLLDMEQSLNLFKGSLGALYSTIISDTMREKRFREAAFVRTPQRTPTAAAAAAASTAATPKTPLRATVLRRELVARNVAEYFSSISESATVVEAPLELPPQAPLERVESQIGKPAFPQGAVSWKGRLLDAKSRRELVNLQEAACKSAYPVTACPFCNDKFSAKNNRNRHVREKCKVIRATASQLEQQGTDPVIAQGPATASSPGTSAPLSPPVIPSSPAVRSPATASLPPPSPSAPSLQFSNMGYAPDADIDEALAKVTTTIQNLFGFYII